MLLPASEERARPVLTFSASGSELVCILASMGPYRPSTMIDLIEGSPMEVAPPPTRPPPSHAPACQRTPHQPRSSVTDMMITKIITKVNTSHVNKSTS